jgi:flagellar hook-basal body complex protein FliE
MVTMPAIPPLTSVTGLPPVAVTSGVERANPASGAEFGNELTRGIDALQQTQATTDNLATKAATGSLNDITTYMIAANEASIATSLTTAVRDKAVAAFTSIMNMQM